MDHWASYSLVHVGSIGVMHAAVVQGRDLDVHEAKVPEDIYKSHLTEGRSGVAASVDSARQNLASTFVNAFVNCGFCHGNPRRLGSSRIGGGAAELARRRYCRQADDRRREVAAQEQGPWHDVRCGVARADPAVGR